jgi:hypothetical protein
MDIKKQIQEEFDVSVPAEEEEDSAAIPGKSDPHSDDECSEIT